MITIENVSVLNMDNAIRGMRNPLNSWDKSDSFWDVHETYGTFYYLGPKDTELASKLAAAGSDHRKFLRQITVSIDLTAPLYWWKEYDTYKVGTVANSCSTMHTIHKREFTKDDFSFEEVCNIYTDFILDLIGTLNAARENYLEKNDKKYWYSMIQLLPSSYNQKRTCTLNYEVLRTMYHNRHSHKLYEWREFCLWVESLPYAKELIL